MKFIFTLLIMVLAKDITMATMPKNKMPPPVIITLDRLTVYNPVESQTDADPLVTASNDKINIKQLRSGKLRWMAISRDQLKRWGGKVAYGDKVYINVGDPVIDGYWYVKDTMNKRFKRSGDLLFHQNVRKSGRWKNVKIYIIKKRKNT